MISRDNRKIKIDCFPIFKQIIVIIIIVAMLLFVNTFLFKIIMVDGFSMYPTLENGQIVLVQLNDKFLTRGQIVVLDVQNISDTTNLWIKRVVGVGGDNVKIDYDANKVTVNSKCIEEFYLNYDENDPMVDKYGTGTVTFIVPKGSVFVMGDNRNHSSDSRCPGVGCVPEEWIVGSVITLPF